MVFVNMKIEELKEMLVEINAKLQTNREEKISLMTERHKILKHFQILHKENKELLESEGILELCDCSTLD